jgi:hypothetical protein
VSRRSIHTSAGELSFYYLMMADSCFQRAVRAGKAGATLRNIGRDYLMKARKVTSVFEHQPSEVTRTRPRVQ